MGRLRGASRHGAAAAANEARCGVSVASSRELRLAASRSSSMRPASQKDTAAALLRHDDGDRVVFFGDADRRAVPRAEFAAEVGVDASAGGSRPQPRRDPACDDHRAVVQRRRRLEDRHQEVVRHVGVERDAALDVVAQADLALDHDDAPPSACAASDRRRERRSPRSIRCRWGFRVEAPKNGARPTCASARRMSVWNSTMIANAT